MSSSAHVEIDPFTLGAIGLVIMISMTAGVILGASIVGSRAQHRTRRSRPAAQTGGHRLVRPPAPVAPIPRGVPVVRAELVQPGDVRPHVYRAVGPARLPDGSEQRTGGTPIDTVRVLRPLDRRPPSPFPHGDPRRVAVAGAIR